MVRPRGASPVTAEVELVELPRPHLQREVTVSLGMIIFLASWTMMFAALFFSYGLLRFRADVWPPPRVPVLPVGAPALNSLVLVASSIALQRALAAVRADRGALAGRALAVAAALGAVFLALQLHVWTDLWARGLVPASGQYASVFYLLTVFHALHVVVGVVALGWLAVRAGRGAYRPTRHVAISAWAQYWHFVAVVWLLMFVLVYLV